MDRAGDWICGLVFRGVGRGGLVHSMGTHEGLRAVFPLPDCTRAWVTDTAGPRLHRIVAGLATSNYVLANGAGLPIRRLMLKRLSTAFLCGLAIAGQLSGQEVVVARERKPEASEQATRPPERAEPELGASTQTKSHARTDKSTSPAPTLEQMRLAGALAAERQMGRTLQESSTAVGSSSQTATAGNSNASGAVEPTRKETRIEQSSASHASNSRKSEKIAPVRPTMIESGKQEPDASPPGKAEARDGQTIAPQSANRPPRKQETRAKISHGDPFSLEERET